MTKHVHIATVGIRPGPVTKTINAVGRIDVLYLLYTADNDSMDQTHFIENRAIGEDENGSVNYISPIGSTNSSGSKKATDGTTNLTEKKKDVMQTSRQTALEIENRLDNSIPYIHRVVIPLNDYWGIVKKITDIYESERGEGVEFSINITGGTNLMVAAACYASHYAHANMYYMDNKDAPLGDQLLTIKHENTVDIDNMDEMTKDVLKTIYKKSKDQKQITTTEVGGALGVTRQKIKFHLDKLVDQNLVTKEDYFEHDGRLNEKKKNLKVTQLGAIIVTYI